MNARTVVGRSAVVREGDTWVRGAVDGVSLVGYMLGTIRMNGTKLEAHGPKRGN